MVDSLKVLLTNLCFGGSSGTETVTRDLALGLLRNGDQPFVYSPELGELAQDVRNLGVPVSDDVNQIAITPDIIHSHHLPTSATALARFPSTPAIFVCHDFRMWHDAPPRLPNIRRYAAISEGFQTRLTGQAGVKPELCSVVLNGTDLDRFVPGPDLPDRPRRALAFAKNPEHLTAVREACAQRGLDLEVVGAFGGRIERRPETLIPKYDVVFASALTAIEALACGRAVIVCDGRGLAGMVDLERYDGWRRENFGLRTFTRSLTRENVLEELDRYDPAMARALTGKVRSEVGLGPWVASYRRLYRDAMADAEANPAEPEAMAAALAQHLQTWSPAPWMADRTRLLQENGFLRFGLKESEPDVPILASDRQSMVLEGFHDVEDWGAWSRQAFCSACVRLPPEAGVRFVEVTVRLCGDQTFELEAFANGIPIGAHTGGSLIDIRLRFSLERAIGDQSLLWLSFRTTPPRSPKDLGVSPDTRPLGVGLSSVTLISGEA